MKGRNNRVNIAVIQTDVKWIRRSICGIQETIKEVPQIKTDVNWLKFWHNKIVVGVIAALLIGIILGVVKIING